VRSVRAERVIASIHFWRSAAEYAINDHSRVSVYISNAYPFVESIEGNA
jgi:hypothetical protein